MKQQIYTRSGKFVRICCGKYISLHQLQYVTVFCVLDIRLYYIKVDGKIIIFNFFNYALQWFGLVFVWFPCID